MNSIRDTDKILVNRQELEELCSCGKRNAEKIGELAEAVVYIGRMKRYNVQKIREFLYNECLTKLLYK